MYREDKTATGVSLKRISDPVPIDCNLRSQFGGAPYFEKGEQWPVTKNKIPLDFVFQVFNENGVHLPECVKLVQFYYGFGDAFSEMGYDDDERWLVKVYEHLNKDDAIIIKNPNEELNVHYCEVEYSDVESVPDDDKEGESSYPIHTQLGGYAQWIWSNCEPEDVDSFLLFQLDSEDEAGLMWYDSGMVYVHYNPNTKKSELIIQYY